MEDSVSAECYLKKVGVNYYECESGRGQKPKKMQCTTSEAIPMITIPNVASSLSVKDAKVCPPIILLSIRKL